MPKRRQIPRLFSQPGAGKKVYWHWKPERRLRTLGWTNHALGTDKAKAVAEAIRLNEKVDAIDKPESSAPRAGITMSELIDRFFASSAFSRTAPNTQKDYRLRCGELKQWALDGTLQVKLITTRQVRTFREASLQNSSPSVTASRLRTMRRLFNWAVREELIERNPAADVELPKVARRKVYRDWPTIEQAARQADALGCPFTGPALRLGFWTMQRQADLLSFTRFQWREIVDVDPRDRPVLARKNGKVIGLHLSDGQNKTDTPVVCQIPPFLHAEIEARFDQSDWLFPHPDNPLRAVNDTDQGKFGKAVNKTMRQIGMQGVVHKDMRRSGMSWALAMGAHAPDIRAVSGHMTPQAERMDEVYMPRNTRGACRAIAVTLRAMDEIAERARQDGQ